MGGKSTFWDHYTFQRITKYPTRVVGTTDDGSLCAIDADLVNEAGEAPVIRYEVGISGKEAYLGDAAPDFGDFFLEGVLLALDWGEERAYV